MSGKLLHERLREFAAEYVIGDFACGAMKGISLLEDDALALADEIERQYVPVPRFPDGEPVGQGSETCYGTVSCIDVEVSDGGWGNWVIHMDDGNCIEGTFSQRVERPAPKLFDADGVETNAGDTVWLFDKVDGGPVGEPMKVDRAVCGTLIFEGGGAMPAYMVTHREPDSLEKLRDDLKEYVEAIEADVPDGRAGDALRCAANLIAASASRFTALMERGA